MTGLSEGSVQRKAWLGLGRLCRLFRLNTGKAWISALGPKGVHRLKDGSILIEAPRPIAMGFGLTNGEPVTGASDLQGWTTITITPEMVGSDVAVYTSFEVKKEKGGTASTNQKNWIKQVQNGGGIAGVIRSTEDGEQIIEDWKCTKARLL